MTAAESESHIACGCIGTGSGAGGSEPCCITHQMRMNRTSEADGAESYSVKQGFETSGSHV